ncbi:N-acetylglucosamine-6-phosphate deacetylase [Aestuariibius sp. HNIBRBA575]|uniref:N-acetylglucosamine-6-phosphate deacetylase n=1 Tax=Aestuariibius sp. HNIBRBA575 TaxID=3233343 RepID=UPI0034A1A9A5
MNSDLTAFSGADIFDGTDMIKDHVLVIKKHCVMGIVAPENIPLDAKLVMLNGGILAPGLVDLQVNGGGGHMFNDAPNVETLRIMACAHAALGVTSFLPTLITDRAEKTQAAIDAVDQAISQNVPGIMGLHLEGPHLSLARKGAHDGELIRPMTPDDLDMLLDAAARLPFLKVTLAPENVTFSQMKTLADAGVFLSIGHSDTSYDVVLQSVENGVRCVTHLFNAMSQIQNREPGLVGAAIATGALSAGLIADFVHVHPTSIEIALKAKVGPGQIFLVSDAMATAGSDIDHFYLNSRRINRDKTHGKPRLTLADGTLAGADLDLVTAIGNVASLSDVSLSQAIAMASSIPARVIGKADQIGHLLPGRQADFMHLKAGKLQSVWQAGTQLT